MEFAFWHEKNHNGALLGQMFINEFMTFTKAFKFEIESNINTRFPPIFGDFSLRSTDMY